MVITCLAACGMTHKESYKPIFITFCMYYINWTGICSILGIAFYLRSKQITIEYVKESLKFHREWKGKIEVVATLPAQMRMICLLHITTLSEDTKRCEAEL